MPDHDDDDDDDEDLTTMVHAALAPHDVGDEIAASIDDSIDDSIVDPLAATVEQPPHVARSIDGHDPELALDDADLIELSERELFDVVDLGGSGPVALPPELRTDAATFEQRRAAELHVDAVLGALERELRATGTLSFATCEALRVDVQLRGLELCLAFLRCTVFAGDANLPAVLRRQRVQTCRLLLLSIAAHTSAPRWSSFQLEQLVEAALSIPGAELSDLVQALFALLVDSRGPVTHAQLAFIRGLAAHVTAKRRRGHPADDFVWIAVRLDDPCFPATEAQALLAAHVLPRRMRRATRDPILRALVSSHLVVEVLQLVGGPGVPGRGACDDR